MAEFWNPTGINDSLVQQQQGPNYVLVKRLQRWHATLSREAGAAVSMNVAPRHAPGRS